MISQFHDVRSSEHAGDQAVALPVRFKDRQTGHRYHPSKQVSEDVENAVRIVFRLKNACRLTQCLREGIGACVLGRSRGKAHHMRAVNTRAAPSGQRAWLVLSEPGGTYQGIAGD